MATYLMTWNPDRWPWDNLREQSADVRNGRVFRDTWSSGNTKKIRRGDRLFLLRQGSEPRGIFASAWVTRGCYTDKHFDTERRARGDTAMYVGLRFDSLLVPGEDPIIPRDRLDEGVLGRVKWNTQASGIEIEPAAARKLERLWARHLARRVVPFALDDELAAVEGQMRLYLIRHRRRERRLRDVKIQEVLRLGGGRLRCEVPGCGFDFLTVYGELGRDYAQVHHTRPLGRRAGPSVTPLAELVIVCANCHAMIHRGGESRSLAGLIPE